MTKTPFEYCAIRRIFALFDDSCFAFNISKDYRVKRLLSLLQTVYSIDVIHKRPLQNIKGIMMNFPH